MHTVLGRTNILLHRCLCCSVFLFCFLLLSSFSVFSRCLSLLSFLTVLFRFVSLFVSFRFSIFLSFLQMQQDIGSTRVSSYISKVAWPPLVSVTHACANFWDLKLCFFFLFSFASAIYGSDRGASDSLPLLESQGPRVLGRCGGKTTLCLGLCAGSRNSTALYIYVDRGYYYHRE